MKRWMLFLSAFVGVLATAGSALALDMEYYTYGGFNPIVQAFVRIALIFSDANYQGLIFVMTVVGIMAGAAAWIAKAATGARIIPLTWTVPVLFGAIVYLAVFVPKGHITVYDPVLNRFQTVGDIPDAIVFTAGTLNLVERGLVDIIDTSATLNAAYTQTAGGIGFKTLESVKGSLPKDNYARTSMIRYVKDCLTFELMRPGTALSLDDLRNTSTDFLVNLTQAANPSIYTVYYDAANPAGTAMTCTQAWTNLQPVYATAANYTEAIRKVCSKAYYDPDNAAELTTCRNQIENTLNFTTGTPVTPERIIQQRQIAEILYTFYFQDDVETSVLMESDRKITSSGLGIGLTMNEWIPVIRAVMTAIAIGVIPFLALFLPTPIVGKAASVMLGFFVFLSTWGVTDAVIHGAAMDYAAHSFEEVRQSSLGVYAMAALPSVATKVLAMFGVIRSAGIMLASLFSMMLIRFGGHALAMLAGNLSGLVQGAGSHAGALLTPDGLSSAMNRQVKAAGLLDGMAEHRFANLAAAESWGLHKSVGGQVAAMNARRSLQEAGQIAASTSQGDFAAMMAAANQSVGTASGPVAISTGPDGTATRMRSESINPDGSASVVTLGSGGTGTQEDILAAGRASYTVDNAGVRTTTQASVHGLDPVKVGAMAVQQKVAGAARTLGSDSTWGMLWQQVQRDSLAGGSSRSYADTLNNALSSSWKRAFNDQSGFMHTLDETQRTQIKGMLGIGGSIENASIGADGQLSVVGSNGESVSFKVTEGTMKAFARDEARVRSEAVAQTFSEGKGLDYLANVAKRIGATEASSIIDEARSISRSQESYGADLTTALVKNYARERYGEETPETIRRTISDFNSSITQQGAAGVNNMRDIVSGFVSGKGYGWGSTGAEVRGAMDKVRNQIHDQKVMQGFVDQRAGSVRANTAGIIEKNRGGPYCSVRR
ncbi:MAG: conjugal transfer protein TraG N-terminal domain-containing protein [Desulfobulbus sp.]|nr:conjugal transfer protein TraG N-terminal domain-containing protein [Desulfobulbus sp.]